MQLILRFVVGFTWLFGSYAWADDEAPGKRVALLVGINAYQKPIFDNLKYAERDVEEVAKELKALGFEVTLLTGSKATRQAIDDTALKLALPLAKDDVMLVMLCGHGLQLDVPLPGGGTRNDAFFCPYDAIANSPASLFSLTRLIDDILNPNVGRKLVLIDACRNDPDPSRGSRGIEGKVIALPEDTAVMFSCRKGQKAFENDELRHGLFTFCVLEGLRGQAIQDGVIGWGDLQAFVNRRMASADFRAKYLPGGGARQEPIPAGGVPYTVLGRLARVTPAPAPSPTVPIPSVAPSSSGRQQPSITSSIGMTLQLIPAGEFLMGGDQSPNEIVRVSAASKGGSWKADQFENEQPQHRVGITKPFYLGIYEVTQAEWKLVMGSNPSSFSATGENRAKVTGLNTSTCPVEEVSWFDAIEFCNKLSQQDGLQPYYLVSGIESVNVNGGSGYRLPTEAEWEYACRAGTTTAFHFGASSNGREANIDGVPYGTTSNGTFLARTTSVGKYVPNAFGLYDMHGNVWEWCFDAYKQSAYKSRSGTMNDPQEEASGATSRVRRGGSWGNSAMASRSASRAEHSAEDRDSSVGFRVARNP